MFFFHAILPLHVSFCLHLDALALVFFLHLTNRRKGLLEPSFAGLCKIRQLLKNTRIKFPREVIRIRFISKNSNQAKPQLLTLVSVSTFSSCSGI